MVIGLAVFREHFRNHSDQFVLIGGTACDLIMSEAGAPFRSTKDIDMVLLIESLKPEFMKVFWDFIRKGGYSVRERENGSKQFYRFAKPTTSGYPVMLELFSRAPDGLIIPEGSGVASIRGSEGISGLSAILLDEAYYGFLKSGIREIEGLFVVGAEHLLVLKAKAWLDLSAGKRAGKPIDSEDILKHKRDIFRIFQIARQGVLPVLPEEISVDMDEFLQAVAMEKMDLRAIGVKVAFQDAVEVLRKIFFPQNSNPQSRYPQR